MGFNRKGKLYGNNLPGTQFAAQSGADAVLAKFVGATPIGSGQAFTKYADLNAYIKTIPGEATQPSLSYRRRLSVVTQFRLSIFR